MHTLWKSSSRPQHEAHLRAHQRKNTDGSLPLWRLRTQARRVPRTGRCPAEPKAKIGTSMGLLCWGRNLLAPHQRCLVLRRGGCRGTRESVVVAVVVVGVHLVGVVVLFWEPSSSSEKMRKRGFFIIARRE